MHIRHLAFLILFQPLFACQSGSDTIRSLEANILASLPPAAQQDTGKVKAAATNVIFQSLDGGQSWQDVSAGLPKGLSKGRISANADNIFLATEKKLFQSGQPSALPVWENVFLMDMEISDVFAGQRGTYIISYRNSFSRKLPGTNMLVPLDNTLPDKTVRTILETPDGALFVGCESGIYKSADDGSSWKQVFAGSGANSLVAADGVLLSGTDEGMLRSTDGGEHWNYAKKDEGGMYNTKRIEGGFVTLGDADRNSGMVFETGLTNKLLSSTDGGITWQRIDNGLSVNPFIYNLDESVPKNQSIYDIEQAGKYLFCSTDAGVFRSSDAGKSWELVFKPATRMNLYLSASGKVIFAVQVPGC